MNEDGMTPIPAQKMALWAVLPGDHDEWCVIRVDSDGLCLDARERAYIKALFEIAERNLHPIQAVTP